MSNVPASVWSSESMRRRLMVGDDYVAIDRQEMPGLDLLKRWDLNHEVELGFDKLPAFEEAKRCLQCQLNIFLDGPHCILCNGCVDACPTRMISMVSVDTVAAVDGDPNHRLIDETRSWRASAAMLIDEDLCIRCGLCIYRCPTNCITMQHYVPEQKTVATIPLQSIKMLQPAVSKG